LRTSPHLEMGFPGEITISSSYLLTNDNQLIMKWKASMQGQDGLQTPINLCNHAYWNLSGDFKERSIADHQLCLNASRVLEFGQGDYVQIPTGTLTNVEGTPFDFTTKSRIGDKERLTGAIDGGGQPGIDHAFCIDGADPDCMNKMHKVATLSSAASGFQMEMHST